VPFGEQFRRRVRRPLAMSMARRPLVMRNEEPVVSFTFDDFPRSALLEGGAILGSYGQKGTFFASFGLMGSSGPTGEIFSVDDVHEVVRQGHELGCHTYDHYHAWDTAPSEFQASIVRNREALEKYLPGTSFRSLSYPISCPRPQTKRIISAYFDCCRGGGQTFNAGALDLNFLMAFFLEKSRNDFDSVVRLIEANNRKKGWLIFATHDVSESPTEFGCTPAFFEKVVRHSSHSGANVLTVCEALDKIRDSNLR
jgi:peptidoglycan/xylan/chitin deacetylase (PgdA/CDA1 family)